MKKNMSSEQEIEKKLKRIVEDNKSPTVVDLFAGCGGLSLGFQRAGYEILAGVEMDEKAAHTHAENFFINSALHNEPEDITKLHPKIFQEKFLNDQNQGVDLIVGGPPCQAFARIGRAKLREIMDHPEAFLNDSRASLYVNFLEYVEYFKPLAVVMENVVDIMNFGGKNVAEEIASSLDELGYISRYTILNSAHYGVPQMRQRFFLIAFHASLDLIPIFPEPTNFIDLPIGYSNAKSVALGGIQYDLFQNNGKQYHYVDPPIVSHDLPPAVTAKDALLDLPPITSHLNGKMAGGVKRFDKFIPYKENVELTIYIKKMREWPNFEAGDGIFDHVTRKLSRDTELFRKMRPGDQYPEAHQLALKIFKEKLKTLEQQNGKTLAETSKEYKDLKRSIVPPYDPGKFPNKWRKMEPDMPARTLTAHIGKDTYSHIHYDSSQARVISVREAARLQSFPDGFKFSGAMNAAFRQIGNAVPPLLAYKIAENLRNQLLT